MSADCSNEDRAFFEESYRLPIDEKCGISTFLPIHGGLPCVDKQDLLEFAKSFRAQYQRARSSIRKTHYVAAAIAYTIAVALFTDDALWDRFVADPFWTDHSRLDRAKCLRYSLMYLYGGHRGAVAERARDHARALTDFWNRGASAEVVLKELEQNGFDDLKRRIAPRDRRFERPSSWQRCTLHTRSMLRKRLARMNMGEEAAVLIRIEADERGRRIATLKPFKGWSLSCATNGQPGPSASSLAPLSSRACIK